MGGRQSQEPSPSPVEVTHHAPSSSHLPALSEYPHLRPALRPHSHGPPRNTLYPFEEDLPPSPSRPAPRTSAEQLMELDIALTTLQHRLQARRGAHERPQGHRHHIHIAPHPSSLNSGLPLLFFRQIATLQCPLCSKDVLSSEMEAHMAQCVTRPRVTYNADTLTQESGECSICLDDLLPGEEIARLPCLCIYHLKCTQQWFKVSQTCPEHPDLA